MALFCSCTKKVAFIQIIFFMRLKGLNAKPYLFNARNIQKLYRHLFKKLHRIFFRQLQIKYHFFALFYLAAAGVYRMTIISNEPTLQFCELVIRPRAIRGIFTGQNKTFHFRCRDCGRDIKIYGTYITYFNYCG